MSKILIQRGSGNVYKDLKIPNAEEMQAKAILVSSIVQIVKNKKWNQKKAAEVLGVTQPKFSLLSRGQFSGFSIGKLINMLNKLQQDIEIIIRDKHPSKKHVMGHFIVTHARAAQQR
jgi:predicted XRE-type DNA-binding protein